MVTVSDDAAAGETLSGRVRLEPAGPSGPTDIEVTEGGETTRGTVRVIGVGLSAPDVDLSRGERTTLSVQVTGLEGLDEPIPLTVVNRSPDRVRLSGGDTQVIAIEPSGVSGDEHTWTATLTGVRPGAFEISAYVPWLRNPAPGPIAVTDDNPELEGVD